MLMMLIRLRRCSSACQLMARFGLRSRPARAAGTARLPMLILLPADAHRMPADGLLPCACLSFWLVMLVIFVILVILVNLLPGPTANDRTAVQEAVHQVHVKCTQEPQN